MEMGRISSLLISMVIGEKAGRSRVEMDTSRCSSSSSKYVILVFSRSR
jgi:hypothetical protein